MKPHIAILILGIIIGSASTYLIMRDKVIPPSDIAVNPISGNPVVIDHATAGSNSVSIIEHHDGQGSSEVIIPYDKIPPAYNWMHRKTVVQVLFSPRKNIYGIATHRIESVLLSAGFCIPFGNISNYDRYDVFAGAGYMFDL